MKHRTLGIVPKQVLWSRSDSPSVLSPSLLGKRVRERGLLRQSLALLILSAVAWSSASTLAADYRTEPLAEPPPKEGLAEGIAKTLAPQAVRVIRGTKTKYCDIWLCQELQVQQDFEPTSEVLYPFTPGQLIGVVRFSRRGSDFRDQDIDRGLYTLRYAQQPVDGAHVGTSLTRDFLLLVQAEHDQSVEPLEYDRLTEDSAEAAGSSHPCLLSMQRVAADAEHARMHHDEDHDWWILTLNGRSKAGDKASPLVIRLVVVGVGEE